MCMYVLAHLDRARRMQLRQKRGDGSSQICRFVAGRRCSNYDVYFSFEQKRESLQLRIFDVGLKLV